MEYAFYYQETGYVINELEMFPYFVCCGRFPLSTSVSPANLHSIFISFSFHLH
jgi:hypothetical protein